MAGKDEHLRLRLLALFQEEAREHLQAIAQGLVALERDAGPESRAEVLDVVFRAAHSLKGSARAVTALDIETVCQALESIFAGMKRAPHPPGPEVFDLLHRTVALLEKLLPPPAGTAALEPIPIMNFVHALRAAAGELPAETALGIATVSVNPSFSSPSPSSSLSSSPAHAPLPPSASPASAPSPAASPSSFANPAPAASPAAMTSSPFTPEEASGPARPAGPKESIPPAQGGFGDGRSPSETVRVATHKLDAVLIQAEELLSAKLAAAAQAGRLRQVQAKTAEWKKRGAQLRADLRQIQSIFDEGGNSAGVSTAASAWKRTAGFMEWSRSFSEALAGEMAELADTADRDRRAIGARVDHLLEEVEKIVMQPFSTLLDLFPPLVRELSRSLEKGVDLTLTGGEIEIDRRILEEIKDPLIHLIRNGLDHGIEKPEDRARCGKPRRGRLAVAISPKDSGRVELLISDDGAGIDAAKVKEAAIRMGRLTPDEAKALGDEAAFPLVFQPGLSTRPSVTELSGRGLGLAIVQEKVAKLNGVLAIETAPGRGSAFRIVLPVTLSRFRGIAIRVAGHDFVVPSSQVERVARIPDQGVRRVAGRETVELYGRALALIRLEEVFNLRSGRSARGPGPFTLPVLVAASGGQSVALAVDEILQEQEVLVKSLGSQLVRVRNFAGATILAGGKVAPIVSVADLIQSAAGSTGAVAAARRMAEESAASGSASTGSAADKSAGKSILVAEDSITARALLKGILENAGYAVETAVDGVDALAKLRTGPYDAIVSDVDMPRMNGFGLAAQVRGDPRLAGLPLILVTALESPRDREHGMNVGASAYLVKSGFDQANLLETLRRFL